MHRKPGSGRLVFWVVALVIAALAAFYASRLPASNPQPATPIPSATSPVPSPTPSSRTATPTPTVVSTPPLVIAQSMPVEVYIPSLDAKRRLDDKPCPLVNGKIDPDRSDYMQTCVVKGDNLAAELPGTTTPNTTMIAGHTWRARSTWKASVDFAAFNALYNWETGKYTLKKGDEVWLRTKASGKRWLVYVVSGFAEPTKTADNDELWGHADKPVPNSLKLVGCQQPSDYSVHSTNNIVVQAVFTRVEG
jgi:hypothetical protein